ncbi:hypothetical protein ACFL1S_08440 [Pseudomonadota bacterium]
MKEKFDFEAALKAIQSGQAISGKDGVLAPLVKQLTEAALLDYEIVSPADRIATEVHPPHVGFVRQSEVDPGFWTGS